jgi:hypothetical protein
MQDRPVCVCRGRVCSLRLESRQGVVREAIHNVACGRGWSCCKITESEPDVDDDGDELSQEG